MIDFITASRIFMAICVAGVFYLVFVTKPDDSEVELE